MLFCDFFFALFLFLLEACQILLICSRPRIDNHVNGFLSLYNPVCVCVCLCVLMVYCILCTR